MRQFVAKALVFVISCSVAYPALANSVDMCAVNHDVMSSGSDLAVQDRAAPQYWMASSEYYVHGIGRSSASLSAPRRVLITGYHPVAGFEAEIAEEAALRAAHSIQ